VVRFVSIDFLVLLVCRFTLQLQSLERIEAEQKAMIEKLTNS
jgi:hypothetical protein